MDAGMPSPRSAPILVASGHDALRHAVRRQLGEAGYEVVAVDVAGVASAIAYLHFAQVPHLVLLDCRMELVHVQRILQDSGALCVDEAFGLSGERWHQPVRPQTENVAMALESGSPKMYINNSAKNTVEVIDRE